MPGRQTTAALPLPAIRTHAGDLFQLAKPRLNSLVVATTVGGYYLAGGQTSGAALLLHTLIGTALVAGGAAAFNQYLERVTDGIMRRTARRPIPDGRVSPADAAVFGVALTAMGLAQLAIAVNVAAAAVALLTHVLYVAAYTPLKRRTPWATAVGAIPGALPPIIGWVAVRGTWEPACWVLFAIGFFWQIPHFLAIAWLYREDYSRAGLRMLPAVAPDGRSTGQFAAWSAAALLVVGALPFAFGLAGAAYLVAAAILGAAYLTQAIRFARARSDAAARWLFATSIVYLPALWIAMIAG